MTKVTILKTNNGTKILGTMQCSNGAYWDAEGCYKYCNNVGDSEIRKEVQAHKLLTITADLGHDSVEEKEWYKNRDNFIDVEIPYYTNQEYQYLNRSE